MHCLVAIFVLLIYSNTLSNILVAIVKLYTHVSLHNGNSYADLSECIKYFTFSSHIYSFTSMLTRHMSITPEIFVLVFSNRTHMCICILRKCKRVNNLDNILSILYGKPYVFCLFTFMSVTREIFVLETSNFTYIYVLCMCPAMIWTIFQVFYIW